MSNDTQSKFTPEEHELFNKIAIDIKNNVDSYCQAGQWLDKFYNEVGKNRTPSIIIKFGEARKNLTEKYEEENFLTEEDAKKVIIITWLLTDPDAENNKLNITKFEEWKWEPLNDVTKLSRGFAGFLFAQNKDTLMRLVRIGWDKITTSRQIASKDKKKSEKFWQTNTFKFVVIPLLGILVLAIMGIPAWILLFNKTSQHSMTDTNIFADVSPDGAILRSNNFPWKIKKTKDQDGNILYTIVDRGGDSTAISVVPDNPKYTVYQSYGGMVIKFTCAEEKISNFTIKLKY